MKRPMEDGAYIVRPRVFASMAIAFVIAAVVLFVVFIAILRGVAS